MTVRDEPRALRDEDAFDVEAVHAWLAERLKGLTGPPAVRQFSGGASNLTYLLGYPDRDLVLRRPPVGAKAASAHDMRREFRVQDQLRPHYPHVPRVLALCDDPAVIGSDFYVMERLDGMILRSRLPDGLALTPEQARALADRAVDSMPTRAEVVERYSAASGTAVDGWAFYEVFGLFRLAGIVQQIYLRYTRGQTTNPAFQHLGIFVTYLETRCAAIMGPASIGRA